MLPRKKKSSITSARAQSSLLVWIRLMNEPAINYAQSRASFRSVEIRILADRQPYQSWFQRRQMDFYLICLP
jgi:hypothetical protein